MKTLGILPLGRPTFDVPYAEQQLAGMLSRLDAIDYKITGSRNLLFDSESTIEQTALKLLWLSGQCRSRVWVDVYG